MREERSQAARLLMVMTSFVMLLALVIGGFALWVVGGPAALLARELPTEGSPELNIDYRADIDCLRQFHTNGEAWRLTRGDGRGWPPPEEPFGHRNTFSTWSVPGIVRFTSDHAAIFRAQTDGSEWAVGQFSGPLADGACI
jgi:hypothetical protein